MAGVKGKGIVVDGDKADELVGSFHGQNLPTHDSPLVSQAQFAVNGSNRVAALQRLSDQRIRGQTAKSFGTTSAPSPIPSSTVIPQSVQSFPNCIYPAPSLTGELTRFTAQYLFKKELKCSDVGQAGRIVIPKGYAENFLPILNDKDGYFLLMDDMDGWPTWSFRYRYWSNNNSRMYVLEKAGAFVKSYGLQAGDFIMIYKDFQTGKFGIRARKVTSNAKFPQHEGDMPINHSQANLAAGNEMGTYFPPYAAPENIAQDFPMDFPDEVLPDILDLEDPFFDFDFNFDFDFDFSPDDNW